MLQGGRDARARAGELQTSSRGGTASGETGKFCKGLNHRALVRTGFVSEAEYHTAELKLFTTCSMQQIHLHNKKYRRRRLVSICLDACGQAGVHRLSGDNAHPWNAMDWFITEKNFVSLRRQSLSSPVALL